MKRYLPFGPLLRDQSDYDNSALDEALNVLPVHGVYRPVRQQRIISTIKFGNSVTPWIHFNGTATGKVDFTGNPNPAGAPALANWGMAIRFKADGVGNRYMVGAGLNNLFIPGTGLGWAVGTESSTGFLRFIYAPGDVSGNPSAAKWSRVNIPGGYTGDNWHVLFARAWETDPVTKSNSVLQIWADGFAGNKVSFGGVGQNGTVWDALDMIWGQADLGGGQAFIGDIERVVTWSPSSPNIPGQFETSDLWAEVLAVMDSPMDGLSDGGWQDGHIWLLRENTGATVNDFGGVATPPVLDGTMDTGVTWEGTNFSGTFSASGITGGLAHFYTATQEALSRGPIADISKGQWSSFGGLPLPGEEPEEGEFPAGQFFPRLNEAVPDDSQGVTLGVPPAGLPDPSEFEVKLDEVPTPSVDTDHFISYRYRFNGKPDEEGEQPFTSMQLTPQLFQGTTLIATLPAHTVTTADEEWTPASVELTTVQAALLTNYADRRMRFKGEIIGGKRQAAVPSADIDSDGWTNRDGESEDEDGNGILFESINDPNPGQPPGPNDTTFVQSPGISPGGTSVYRFKLGEVENPRDPNNFNAVIRLQAVQQGLDARIRIREAGVVRQAFELTDISTTPTDYAFALSPQAMNQIQDFSALEATVTFKAHEAPGGPSGAGLLPTAFDGATVNTTGNATNLRTDDNLTVDTGAGGNGGRFRVRLDAGTDPGTNNDHRIRMRAHRTGGQASASVQLFQGGTKIFDSRDSEGPRLLSTSEQEEVWDLPIAAVQQITAYQSLIIQVLTHAGSGGGTARYDLLSLEYPGAGQGGRKGRLYSFVLGMPSRAWIGVSWVRMFTPDPLVREGDVVELYAGSYSNLYVVDDEGFSNVSKAGGYGGSGIPRSWSMVSFGSTAIASNKVNPVQKRAAGDALFSDLITSVAKPQFATIAVCQNHLVGLNAEYTDVGQGSGGDGQSDEWWASALDDPADFQVSLSTGANRKRILSPAGEVVGAVGGDWITVFKQDSVHRLDYVGFAPRNPTFRGDVISSTAGTRFPRSIVQVDRDVYFLDNDGFRVVRNGQYVDPIGEGAVNRMVTDTAFELRAVQPVVSDEKPKSESVVIGAYDQVTGLIWWALRATGREGVDPDPVWRNGTFVIYNPKEDRWAVLELIGQTTSPADDFTATHLWTLPSQSEASTSLARGIGVLSLDGAYPNEFNLRFRRFLGERTYIAQVRTKIWSSQFIAGAEPGQEILINQVRPRYRMAPESTARPNVQVIVTGSDDPLMQFDLVRDAVTLEDANEDLWYPLHDISGEYFTFEVRIPELLGMTVRELSGIEVSFEDAGEDQS